MTPGEPRWTPLEALATEVLGMEPDPSEAGADQLARLFRKLETDDFLPDPLAHEAILALAGRPIGRGAILREVAAEAEERRLHVEVERYAGEFFALPVESRADRYRRLGQACAEHPRLIERLRHLRPGLTIDAGALADPSPAVQGLLDDQLRLFVLGPEARASESRERAERFRTDPSITHSERSRALKELMKRHPGVVGLLPDHPADLARSLPLPRLGFRPSRVKLKVSPRRFRADEAASGGGNSRAYWIIAVVLLSGIGRLASPSRSTTPSVPSFQAPMLVPVPIAPTAPPDRITPQMVLRAEFKASLRRELIKLGKKIDPQALNRLVAELPFDGLPRFGLLAKDALAAQEARTLFLIRLKAALKATGIGLSDAELDDLAPRCLPMSAGRGAP